MQPDNIKKDLIRKYINQECTPEELEDMKELILLPQTQQLFDEVLAESWTGFGQTRDMHHQDLEEKLRVFYRRLEAEELPLQEKDPNPPIVRRIKGTSYLQYAAVLALFVVGLGTYYLMKSKRTTTKELMVMSEVVNVNGKRSKITLPDSSEVFLGAGSKLAFPGKFKAGTREVSLEGEAFFQVTKNPHRPFIIHTGTVQTKVLGTSFKIEAFKDRPLIVSVATGKVRVDDYAGVTVRSLAILTPGQQVTYADGNAVAGKTVVDDVKSWKDGRLVFDKQTLKEITGVLERWYNVKIIYQDKAKEMERITVVLQASVPLHNIMKVLSATGHFHYKINEKSITIN